MIRRAALLVAFAWTFAVGAGFAPSLAHAQQSGILLLDQTRFFAGSLYGQRVQSEIDAAGRALATENRMIEAELTAEELELTERRADLPREEFSVLAAEFDTRVERIRSEQDAKERALNTAIEQARAQFFELAVPILLDIASDRGAAVIMDRRSVLLAADQVDITNEAIAAVDAALGVGPDTPLVDPTPGAAPIPVPEAPDTPVQE